MNPQRVSFFEKFNAGDKSVWIITICHNETNEMEPIVRKIDDVRLGLPAWIDRTLAETYLKETKGLPPCEIRSVNIVELKNAIAQFSESVRQRIVLDLI